MRLLEDLRNLGFQLEAIGDKVRVRHPAPTPPEAGRLLLEELRRRKAEVLAALAATSGPPAVSPAATQGRAVDPASPWPPALSGLGPRAVGPFAPCLLCQAGTWTRYAGLALCLHHAQSWVETRSTPEGARGMLHALLDIWAMMDETKWTVAEVRALHDQVLAFWGEWGEQAEEWWREWRATHPEARLS